MIDREWLKRKIAEDPDDAECEAGIGPTDPLAVLTPEQREMYARILYEWPLTAAELLSLATENRKLRLEVCDLRSYLEDARED